MTLRFVPERRLLEIDKVRGNIGAGNSKWEPVRNRGEEKKRKKKQKGVTWAGEFKEAKETVLRAGLDLTKVGVGQAPLQMSSNHHPGENTSNVTSLKTHLNPSVFSQRRYVSEENGNRCRCTQVWSFVVPPVFPESPWSSQT